MLTTEKVLEVLNEAFALDPNAMHALSVNRVPCNQALGDHPHIVVECDVALHNADTVPHLQVGMLGVINGLLSASGQDLILAAWSADRTNLGRPKLLGFMTQAQQQLLMEERKDDSPVEDGRTDADGRTIDNSSDPA